MLKSILEIKEDYIDNEEFAEVLSETSLNLEEFKNIFNNKVDDKLVTGTDWIENIKEKDVKEMVVGFSQLGDLLTVSLQERFEDVDFNNRDSEKKIFLVYLSEEWESPISIASALNTMQVVDELEDNYKKSILKLDKEEVSQSIIDLFSEMKYHKLRYQINIISKYQKFYRSYVESNVEWKSYKDVKVLKEIIGDDAKEHILTKRDLINLTKIMPNIQDSIIPLLIFEGVSFSKVDEIDEIRYLKHTDLKGGKIHVNGSEKNDKKTVIELSPEVADLVDDAIKQDFIFKRIGGGDEDIVPLANTEFILRPAERSRRKIATDELSEVISFRGAYSRINLCKEYLEQFLYDMKFTPKSIETFGKVYHINKLINEGFGEIDSIIKTLQRFGNWYPEEGNKRDPKNSQQINRLRKQWSLYA